MKSLPSTVKSSMGYAISIGVFVLCLIWITFFNGDQHYLMLSFICLAASMLPFYWHFETRESEAREIVFLAVLATVAALGRVAMAAVPDVKPTSFVVVMTGLTLGPEAGFIVGSTSAVVSNLFLGQGPWTPWQMFAWGAMGISAGLIRNFKIAHNRYFLATLGLIYGFLFGWIMDLWYVMVYVQPLNIKTFIAAYLASFYFDLAHGVTTAILLYLFYQSWYRIITRFKYKYGLAGVQEEINQQKF
ncbi:ECF transporter S component [uncultured Secundilactobacillus sp.]|uniref:ECF transporter S component n=1 Tax=uncultured Secundilactobacillus sp. TaxID=2813935 RepID=UPI00258373D4|nr:ECF transporter S component [uncultured Secundilactobacillus sp.]